MFVKRDGAISASFATFGPCESHALHREVGAAVVDVSRCHGSAEQYNQEVYAGPLPQR